MQSQVTFLVIPAFAVLIFALYYIIPDAHAVSYDITDQNSCNSIDGSWDAISITCTIQSLTINSTDSVTIDHGVRLSNHGNINNSGTITNILGGILNFRDSTINNLSGGVIINNSTLGNNYGGIINNNGIINNYQRGCICNGGNLTNFGTISNKVGGRIAIEFSSNFTNYGNLLNSFTIGTASTGTITNLGNITNNSGGTISIFDITTNSGTLTNRGTLIMESNGAIDNNVGGIITNIGSISVYDGYINNNEGTIFNSGTMTNIDGHINNFNVIFNSGTIVNNLFFFNSDIINNSGTITNSGTMTNFFGTINEECGAIFTNTGTFIGSSIVNSCHVKDISTKIEKFLVTGCIDNSGVANSFTSKLSAAQTSINAGNFKDATNVLNALINEVDAQAGKHISMSCIVNGSTINPATNLVNDIQNLINTL